MTVVAPRQQHIWPIKHAWLPATSRMFGCVEIELTESHKDDRGTDPDRSVYFGRPWLSSICFISSGAQPIAPACCTSRWRMSIEFMSWNVVLYLENISLKNRHNESNSRWRNRYRVYQMNKLKAIRHIKLKCWIKFQEKRTGSRESKSRRVLTKTIIKMYTQIWPSMRKLLRWVTLAVDFFLLFLWLGHDAVEFLWEKLFLAAASEASRRKRSWFLRSAYVEQIYCLTEFTDTRMQDWKRFRFDSISLLGYAMWQTVVVFRSLAISWAWKHTFYHAMTPSILFPVQRSRNFALFIGRSQCSCDSIIKN